MTEAEKKRKLAERIRNEDASVKIGTIKPGSKAAKMFAPKKPAKK